MGLIVLRVLTMLALGLGIAGALSTVHTNAEPRKARPQVAPHAQRDRLPVAGTRHEAPVQRCGS